MSKNKIIEASTPCGDAILYFSQRYSCTEEQKEAIERGHLAVMQAILEISLSCSGANAPADCRDYVREILRDVHTRAKYRHDEKLIRDLADICITLREICAGKPRGDGKLLEARLFFNFAHLK